MQTAPEQIGPYLIRSKISESPLYIEYLASDSQHSQNVVLRVPGEAFPRTPARLTHFITAGQRAARLQHEHIVPVIGAGQADGEYYIATANVAGQRLTDLLANSGKAIGIEQVAQLIDGIAAALDYAHSQGVDHEGLTTDNIILTQDGRVLVTDFCLAEGLDSSELVHGEDDPAFASYFLAPEQIRTDVEGDFRADIYSLGVVAYAMLTRNLPFEAVTQGELLHKIVNDIPRSPDLLNSQMPAGVAYVLRNVLAKEPEVRYSSAGDFHDALLAGMAWNTPAGATSDGVETTPHRGRRGLVSALLALLVLALIAGGAYLMLQTNILPGGLTSMIDDGTAETAIADPTDDGAMAVAAEFGSTASGSDATSQPDAGMDSSSGPADALGSSEPTLLPTVPPAQGPTATPTPTHTATAKPTESATATPAPAVAAVEAGEATAEDGATERGDSRSSGVALRLPTPTTVAAGVTNGAAANSASQSASAVASQATTNTVVPTATNTTQPTATNTPRPTATNTPRPTATNTTQPTATNTPRPTATNTAAPTATNTPRPTATNTPQPTATNTAAPTATNTTQPTATNTAAPTATNTPQSTATNTAAPTATNTTQPTATNTPRPTATNTPVLPTATNTATTTPVLPTATNTATTTPAPLPTATITPIPAGSGVVQLLTPTGGSAGSGSQTFRWSTVLTPPAGQAFELVFWETGQDPMARGFGLAAPTTSNQLNINLSALDNSGDHPLEPGDYQWGLLLVQTEPSYQRLQFLGAQSAFRFYREGGGSSGGDSGGPPSTGE